MDLTEKIEDHRAEEAEELELQAVLEVEVMEVQEEMMIFQVLIQLMPAVVVVEVTDNIMLQEDPVEVALLVETEHQEQVIEVLEAEADIIHQIITAAKADQVSLL
jgi:hypothetical protein